MCPRFMIFKEQGILLRSGMESTNTCHADVVLDAMGQEVPGLCDGCPILFKRYRGHTNSVS